MGILQDLTPAIQQVNPYFDYRPSQDEGAETVLRMVNADDGGVVLLEGPCGFGKTYAYLIPILQEKQKSSRDTVIIVTDGIALQEQLFHKDIPNILEILGKQNLNVKMLKGRNNYLCPFTYAEAKFTSGGDITRGIYNPEKIAQCQEMEKWATSTATGDTSELSYIPDPEVAARFILLDGDDCLGQKCGMYSDCFYYNNRTDAVEHADIIVTNYHYLFTAFTSGAKRTMLPNGKMTFVFDEAHAIVDIFRDFTEQKMTARQLNKMMSGFNALSADSKAFSEVFRVASDYPLRTTEATKQIKIAMEELREKLFDAQDYPLLVEDIADVSKLRKALMEFLGLVSEAYGALSDITETVLDEIGGLNMDEYSGEDNKDIVKLTASLKKLLSILSLCKGIRNSIASGESIQDCIWVECNRESGCAELHVKKIQVGDELREFFFDDYFVPLVGVISPRVVLTSATLSTGTGFDFIKGQLGITPEIKTYEFIGDSPFNLTEQQLWYLPGNAVDGNAKEFFDYFPKEIREVVDATRGGALCLFTSYANLRKAYEAINRRGRSFTILRQGDAPKTQLLKVFANDVDSVLFATKSFFTGVDVPGPSLRCLILDKLPFAMQGDPVIKKITKSRRSFYDFSIPNMIISLKQAVGRGVRSKDDRCVIVVLDNRLSSASYKTTVNSSFLYKKTGTRDIQDVRTYINTYLQSAEPVKLSHTTRYAEDIPGEDANAGSAFPFSFEDIPW